MARKEAGQSDSPGRVNRRRSAGRIVAACGWPDLILYLFLGAALAIPVVSRISDNLSSFPAAIRSFRALVLEPSSTDAKLLRFFADDYSGIRFLEDSPLTARSPRIRIYGPLYRFLENGTYAPIPWDLLRPGDLDCSRQVNPLSDEWTVLRDAPSGLLIYEPGALVPKPESMRLMGAHPPKLLRSSDAGLEAEFTGEGSLLAIDILKDAEPHQGAVVTFRFIVESQVREPGLIAEIVPYSWDAIDKEHTFKCVTSLAGGAAGRFECSGMVTFRAVPLSRKFTTDGVFLGIRSDAPGVRAVLKNYTYRIYTGLGSLRLRP